jgi:hypothetical protein
LILRGALIAVLVAGCGAQPSPLMTAEVPAPAAPILGCLGIEPGECEALARQVLGMVPKARGAPFAVLVHLYGCPKEDPCPRTLDVREAVVTTEYADGGEPVLFSAMGPARNPRFRGLEMRQNRLVDPSSPRVAGVGPFPFEVGHCGLTWQVDFDGSFWLPVGQVDGEASVIVNSETGEMRLLGPNIAEYRNDDGFVARLARFPGAKRIFLCD